MSFYFPQSAVTLKVLFEDFKPRSQAVGGQTHELILQCKRLSVNGNDYKTSNTFDFEVEYKNFPFDPRTIRACGVTIHLEDTLKLYNEDGSINKIVPTAANAVLEGFVDTESISFDDAKRTVKMEGRDLTALLIDEKYKENRPIALNTPVDQAIKTLIQAFPATRQIKVINKTGSSLPTIAQFYPEYNSGSPLSGHKNVGAHETYWEIIQDLVSRAGLVAFMHLDELWITNPRLIFNSNAAIKFFFGKNLKNLEFKRKLGRHKGFNVLVRSLSGKTVITAKIPEQATPTWLKAMGLSAEPIRVPRLKPDGTIDTDQQAQIGPYMSFKIPHIGTQAALIQIGQKTFEELVRQDLEGSFETKEMVAHSGDKPQDPNYRVYDLTTGTKNGLPLAVGQPVSIEIETDDLSSISRMTSVADRTNYLIRRGYDRTIAALFAQSLGKMASVFYLKSYALSMDQDSGFKLKVNFINFIDLSNKGIVA